MGLFTRERRGISWADQTLDSISAPPSPLVVFFALFITLMYFASYSESKQRGKRSNKGLRLGLVLLPLIAIVVVNMMVLRRWWWRNALGVAKKEVTGEGSWPWGLMLLVVLLLVMVHYHYSFQSAWFGTI